MFEYDALTEVIQDQIWYKRVQLSYLGVPVGTRMTIVRLDNESLFLHSPVHLDARTQNELSNLGRVEYVVSPNNMHHLFIGEYFDAYPNAKIYASPGLPEKRKDLKFNYMLHDFPEPEWEQHLDQTMFMGHPLLREIVFFHKKSGTLIVADLIVNFQSDSHPITRFFTKLGGIYQHPTPPIDFQLSTEDQMQAQKSIDRILQWDFDRIILAHGSIIENKGKDVLRQAFNFLYKAKSYDISQ